MPLHEKKIVAVLPAYNAERTLEATFDDIPKDWVDEILLVRRQCPADRCDVRRHGTVSSF